MVFYTSRHLLSKDMNSQVNFLFDLRGLQKEMLLRIAKIHEDRHEEGTKHATKWAVNVFNYLCIRIALHKWGKRRLMQCSNMYYTQV